MQTKLTYEIIQKLPKAELHCHLDGSLRPQTVLDLAKEQNVELPVKTIEEIRNIMTAPLDCPDLVTYLQCFDLPLMVMQYPYAITRIFYEVCEDAVKDGITYLEIRFAPALHTKNGYSYSQILDAAIEGCIMAETRLPITARIICCGMRQMDPEINAEIAEICWRYRHRYVCAFDLAGPEFNFPPHKHVKAFRTIREKGLGVTIHAGEAFGASSVDLALECSALRIGHGTRVVEDQKVLDDVIDRRIPLECCVSSNVQTKAVIKLEDHPIKKLFDMGTITVPCTDNPTVSGVTLTHEYLQLQDTFGFSVAEILKCIDYGFRAAFVSQNMRKRLRINAFIRSMKILQENNIDISGVIANASYYAKLGLKVPLEVFPPMNNPSLNLDIIKKIPKCDLDCRLIGSVPFDLLYEFYQNASENVLSKLPKFNSKEDLINYVTEPEEQKHYIKGNKLAIELLQTKENISKAVKAIVEEAYQDNIIYLELNVCPYYHAKNMKNEEFLDVVIETINNTVKDKDIRVNVVIYADLKHQTIIQVNELAKLSVSYQDRGVSGFTTTASEITESEMKYYESIFTYLRKNHVPVTIYAGENETTSVPIALIRGHATRISGGYKIAQSESLLSDITFNNVGVLFNSSPVMDNEVKGWKKSPIRFFYDFGVRLAFCSVDHGFKNKSRSQQIYEIAEQAGFDVNNVMSIINNSFATINLHYKYVNMYQKRFWEESVKILKENGFPTHISSYAFIPELKEA